MSKYDMTLDEDDFFASSGFGRRRRFTRSEHYVRASVECLEQGRKAMLCLFTLVSGKHEMAWIPYGQIHRDSPMSSESQKGDTGILECSAWILQQKRLNLASTKEE
jgi:hypothetical protein